MIKPATHRGNCQVCGHQQHVMDNGLAKHGYTIDFGYFSGACGGSGEKPVQQERTLTDATIDQLKAYAARQDVCAANYKSGKTLPARIQTGKQLDKITYKYVPVYIEFSEGTEEQKTKAVALSIAHCEGDARGARAHAAALKEMADRLHGKDLIEIKEEIKKEEPVVVVDVKAAKVIGTFRTKAARNAELEKVSRLFEKEVKKLADLCLAVPHDQRTDEQKEVYYGPTYPHQWRAKHSALARKVFPQASEIIDTIEELVKVRDAIKNAP